MKRLAVITAALVLIAMTGCAGAKSPVAFTVNGVAAEKDELIFYMRDYSALAAAELEEKYGLDSSADDFWALSYDEVSPIEYLKQYTVREIIAVKAEQLLAREQGIKTEMTYTGQKKAHKKHNEDRKKAERAGELLYGPVERDFGIYMSEILLAMSRDLMERYIETGRIQVSEADAKAFFEQNRGLFSGGYDKNRTAIIDDLNHQAYENILKKAAEQADVVYVDMDVDAGVL